jgi:hypothetical protein
LPAFDFQKVTVWAALLENRLVRPIADFLAWKTATAESIR